MEVSCVQPGFSSVHLKPVRVQLLLLCPRGKAAPFGAFWSFFKPEYFCGVYGQLSFQLELSASAPRVWSGDNSAALPCQFN